MAKYKSASQIVSGANKPQPQNKPTTNKQASQSAAPVKNNTSQASQSAAKNSSGKKYASASSIVQEAHDSSPKVTGSFNFLGNVYSIYDDNSSKLLTGYLDRHKKADEEKKKKTGHETLGTDIKQSLSGGLNSWGSSQLSSIATLGLAGKALANKDNFYEPEQNSTLWKMLKASSANTRAANELMENSKEGRGKVGQIVMDVGSQAVMNGIDAAIRSIPGIGTALGTASFMSRSFGGTAQQKRDEGKGIATQVLSGAVSAGIEQFTEGMSRIGGIRSYTGADTGWLDGAYTMLESSVAKKLGPVVAKLSTTMLSEGIEEVMSDILSPLVTGALENVTKDSKLLGDFEAEQWQSVGDIAYDGLIGALSAIGGGMVEATGAMNTYRNEANSDNALYSTMLRQQYENDRAEAKRGKALQLGSLFDAVNTLFNKETGESLTERASKAAGTFVRNKDVGKVLAQTDADYVRVVNEVAEKFANQSFANEAVDKDVLKQGVINFFLNGDFSEDLNSIEGAKGQLKKLAQEIMKADAESRLAKAKSTKNKTKEAYYSSLLANLVNSSFAEESTNANVDNITEARTYGYTAEELAADQAAREAERQRMESKGTYDEGADVPFYNGEDSFAEEAPAPVAPAVETETAAVAEVEPAAEVESAMPTAETVAPAIEEQSPTQTESGTIENTRELTDAEKKLSKTDLKKVDSLFDGTKKSLVPSVDDQGRAIVNAIWARAKQENKEVISKDRKDGRRSYSLVDKTGEINGEQAVQSNTTEQLGSQEAGLAEGESAGVVSDARGVYGLGDEVQERPKRVSRLEREYSRITEELNTTGKFSFKGKTYSFTSKSGEEVGNVVKNQDTIKKLNEEATKKLTDLAGKQITYLWCLGNVSCVDADGKESISGGAQLNLGNGKSICICNISSQECLTHETGHGIQTYLSYKFGDFETTMFVTESVKKALGNRVNHFFNELRSDESGLYKDLDRTKLFYEAFAYLINGDSFFTADEVNNFHKLIVDKDWQSRTLGSSTTAFDKLIESAQKAYNRRSDFNMSAERTSSSEEIPTLDEFRKERGDNKRENLYEQREGQDEAARQAERLAMDDAEYNELRQADKAIPTIQEFERGEDQPVAPKKASPSEANEIAERSFGKKGRVRATRVVENFRNRINANLESLTDAQKSHLEESMGKLSKALEDINDGYGTVKDLADTYRAWRDDKLLADYYDEDVAARFDKILEDAEAKGWTFEAQDQREFAQAYEEACNAMTAKINNVNKSADRLSKLKTEAIANKLNIKNDGLISKTIQRFIRMQITTDTAMKLFGGFKGSGEFYQLAKDIKDGVAKRMIKYVDAYSHFDNLKKMEGFKEFSQNTKKYQLEFNNEFNDKGVGLDNPLKGVDLSLQQIVTISRLIKTLDKTFEHSDAKAADRVKGFVIRDSNGNSKIIDLGLGDTTDTGEAVKASGKMTAIKLACDRILNQDGAVFEVARAYDKACDAMFKSMGKDVSAVKKALTGNALSLIGEDYTPVLWANDDGSPAEFNFNDDDRLRPPAFLYNRTAKQGNLVVSDISYIVDKYIEKAADYIGTAEIKDTLARLNDGTSLLDKGKGLNSSLAENFGKDAGTWFDEYVKDLTQYGENDSIWAALRRNMQKGALIGSPSVMMKQTSSYWSAMGLLSPEALAMAYRWKVGVKAADNSEYNKLLKYRHISDNIDPTLTEIIKGVDKYGKASNSRVFQLFTNGISEQDFKTVDNLYTATMIDTYLKNQNKGAEYFTSGEFQNDIDSKFTEVMMRSQPMFDTELRAEYARTDNELVKMTSMFRTQQTQNLNLIATAICEYNASKGTGEQGEKLKVLQQTVAGQASAALSLALLSVAADFMLHGLKKYRGDGDDDDEEPGDGKIELGRILGRIGLNTVETGAGTVWFGDSVAKWLIDRMSGGETNEFYGLNMGPITTFKNVLDNLEYVAKSPTPSNIKNVATNISQLMGIPLNNAYRIVNSAVMYVEDVAGVNDKNYDDMLKKVTNRTKVNEKNVAGRNLLVESGMTKREATAFVKTVDVDDNGLNKEDLQNYYIEHPEDAERVSILWDSMGWKTKFEKEQKSLDKKVVYNSNPLYAEMDEDESGSVTKTEMMDYALEHEDQIDELSALYKEQGFKGSFRSALKSAENSKLKEQAEDAFYEGDYNVLFDTVSQMKNGKTYLTNLIKDEYDEYDNVSNPLVRYMIDAKRPVKEIDEAVEAYGAKKFIPQYKALRATGLAPKAAIQKLDNFDANANGSITQQELADYYKAHKDEEAMIAEFWKACGWSTTWSKYKKRKKLK